jgi:hypothetical protein
MNEFAAKDTDYILRNITNTTEADNNVHGFIFKSDRAITSKDKFSQPELISMYPIDKANELD